MKRFEILLPWDYNDGTQVERITAQEIEII